MSKFKIGDVVVARNYCGKGVDCYGTVSRVDGKAIHAENWTVGYPNGCMDESALEHVEVNGADPVEHPAHYTGHPSGVECIQITEHMNFCRGNAMKYLWRAGEKGDEVEDLKKARWYIDREIARLTKESA